MTTAKPLSVPCGVHDAIEPFNPVAAALAALKTDTKYESPGWVVHQQYTDNNSILVAVEWKVLLVQLYTKLPVGV